MVTEVEIKGLESDIGQEKSQEVMRKCDKRFMIVVNTSESFRVIDTRPEKQISKEIRKIYNDAKIKRN